MDLFVWSLEAVFNLNTTSITEVTWILMAGQTSFTAYFSFLITLFVL